MSTSKTTNAGFSPDPYGLGDSKKKSTGSGASATGPFIPMSGPVIPTTATTGVYSPDQLMSELNSMKSDYSKTHPTTTGSHPTYNQGVSNADKYDAERHKSFKDAFKAQLKRAANHEWYMKNQERKRAYNKKYYRDNVEYWKKRYLEEVGNAISRGSDVKTVSRDPSAYNMSGGNSAYNDKSKWSGAGSDYAKTALGADAKIAKMNYERALRDIADYETNHQKISPIQAWRYGKDSLIDTAKDARDKVKSLGSDFLRKVLQKELNR